MPIPSPGTYDQASQATLLSVKAKTDLLLFPDANILKTEPGSQLTPSDSVGTVNATSILTVAIQPPAGQTWLVYITAHIISSSVANYVINIRRRIAAGTLYGGISNAYQAVTMGDHIATGGWFWIDITTYAEVYLWNGSGVGKAYGISYFGWRIA